MQLSNARILLTGASGGLGQALAQQLAAAGARLLLAGRDTSRLAATLGALGDGHSSVCADLTRPEGIAAAVGAARQFKANVLINNAGVGGFGLYTQQGDGEIDALLATNLGAPMLLTHTLLPWLLAQPQATIVNVGSIFGTLPFAGFVAYSTAKAGLRAFSQALRRELADTQVSVVYLAPRAIDTAFNSTAVNALNRALNNRSDSADDAARRIVATLARGDRERHFGFPERLLAWINSVAPALIDRGVAGELPIIKQHSSTNPPERSPA